MGDLYISLLLVLVLHQLSPPVDGCAAGRRKRESLSGDQIVKNMKDNKKVPGAMKLYKILI